MMTSSTLNNIIAFTVGAAIGSAVTWKFVKTKYERIAQEEIDSVKVAYAAKKEEKEEEIIREEVRKESAKIIEKFSYASSIEKEDEEMDRRRPYVIPPSEYDEVGYETVSLEYYEDGVLLDERGNIIRNVDEVIGINPEEHFGEYEDDSVFVRDDKEKIDYEILRHEGRYSER